MAQLLRPIPIELDDCGVFLMRDNVFSNAHSAPQDLISERVLCKFSILVHKKTGAIM